MFDICHQSSAHYYTLQLSIHIITVTVTITNIAVCGGGVVIIVIDQYIKRKYWKCILSGDSNINEQKTKTAETSKYVYNKGNIKTDNEAMAGILKIKI
jgi:hypothetical protein